MFHKDGDELNLIKLDYKKGHHNDAFEDNQQEEHGSQVDDKKSSKVNEKTAEAPKSEVPGPAVYDEDNAMTEQDAGIQTNGHVNENIDKVLEDLRGGKRYWRVTW